VRVESLDPNGYDTQGEALREGIYLQVGAFSRAENARQLLDRLVRELALDAGQTRLVLNGALHRVQLGPYASDAAAHTERTRVRERLDLNAVLVRRN
jgi:rare lipoprotein A